ncbi:Protein N-acetyltransferase, RimJ/RimL family [Micromonospora sediminicola]|uniref:Protein N-acetyltransferase, RimJ/RimL family n=1 Tax=Micromonospora sediminicola TaxID=946078 RepID=A0A1A9BH48_9ACTN|nr:MULTISPECIES: GNAT family N-acetyltransferase [Micromonospora]PGH43235.1 N-acetyltransferase [Micromonospora sp. WMMA1996]SBT68503.1 Protein N-acetyltransferase, RimJ/RimL family [Micromonospora sediminicola]
MAEVRIVRWGVDDLALLRALNVPEVRAHTGGPETDEQVRARHERYLRGPGPRSGNMFTVVTPDGTRVGSVGFWPREWRGEQVYEMGWAVLPAHQGRGLATAAVRAVVAAARAAGDRRFAHAYPSVDNPPSNAVCRKAGFTLLGETEFEYPPGRLMRSNDWRIDLTAG